MNEWCTSDLNSRVGLFSDITEIKAHENKLKHLAQYDALTGLPNRVLLADRMHQAMANADRSGNQVAVAYIDLDGFKQVNDSYGHNIGDMLLVAAAERMRDSIRQVDSLARIGGDEFIAIFADLRQMSSLEDLLHRLLSNLAKPFTIENLSISISASVGVTLYPQTQDSDGDLLQRQADQAMYEAKLAGRNNCRFFDPSHDNAISSRFALIAEVEQALKNDEFELHYQPKVNMATGSVIGAEALIRWHHPRKGLLYPGSFLPDLEDDNISIKIGEWVIDSALHQLQIWIKQDLILPISVNISALQLQQDNFVDNLHFALDKHSDVPAHLLELEILESSSLEDFESAAKVLHEGKQLGVDFAIDDFGSGYSSLVYLNKLPVKTLKIDQEFVRFMFDNPDDEAILRGVLSIASNFKIETLAEGVETLDHVATLLHLGCVRGQGYAISKPVNATDFMYWYTHWKSGPDWYKSEKRKLAEG